MSPRSPRVLRNHNNTQQKSTLFPKIDQILGRSMMNLKMINNHYRSNSTLSNMKKQTSKNKAKKRIHQKSLNHFDHQQPQIQVIEQNNSLEMALSSMENPPGRAYIDQPSMPIIRGRKRSSLIEPFKTQNNDRSDFEPDLNLNNTEESPPRGNRIKFEL